MSRLHISLWLLLAFSLPLSAAERVTVKPYAELAVEIQRQAAARVESLNEAVIAAQVTARVIGFEVRPGQRVEAGQVLVRLEPADYEIGLAAARARFAQAEASLEMASIRAERARRLAPERHISEDELLEAETRLRQAKAERDAAAQEVANAELMLERTTVRAPFDGVVERRLIGTGALASAGAALVEIIALDALEVEAHVPPAQAEGLTLASSVSFEDGHRSWPVQVERVSPVIGRGSRNQQVRLSFVDQAAAPGADGRIVWHDPRPALPGDFVVQRNGRAGVLVADGDTADFIVLEGADAGRPFRIDLPPDTPLIDEGRRRIQPGDRIRTD